MEVQPSRKLLQLSNVPLGRGHVVLFAINPMWCQISQGSFVLVFNAAMNCVHASPPQYHIDIAVLRRNGRRISRLDILMPGAEKMPNSSEILERCLLLIEFPSRVQAVEIKDRVQYQRIAPSRFAAVDRIVREQNHVS